MSETYENILNRMEKTFKDEAGYSADNASDIGIRLKVLAGEIYSCYTNIDWLKMQVFPQTAVMQQLDYHAQERGITRKSAIKSTGTLTFSRATALSYDINIPKGTICSTTGTNEVRFLTSEDATLLQGNLSVDVLAEAEVGGESSNVSSNTITVLITPPSGISNVNNTTSFEGGVDQESDDELRDRLLISYENIPNGTNSAFYIDQALKYEEVYSANTIAKPRGNGSVDVYVAGKGSLLSNDLINEIKAGLNELREINVDLDVKSPDLVNVNIHATLYVKDGYKFETVKEECKEAIKEYMISLKIGQNLYISDICNTIYNIEGVKTYSLAYGAPSNVTATANQLIVLQNLVVDEGVSNEHNN